jgi:hypothetical protein
MLPSPLGMAAMIVAIHVDDSLSLNLPVPSSHQPIRLLASGQAASSPKTKEWSTRQKLAG